MREMCWDNKDIENPIEEKIITVYYFINLWA